MVVVFCQNASKRFADLQIFMQDLAELSSLFMRAALLSRLSQIIRTTVQMRYILAFGIVTSKSKKISK